MSKHPPHIPNTKPFSLHGRISYRMRSLGNLTWASIVVPIRRLLVGPRVPEWKLSFEIANYFLCAQNIQAFESNNVSDSRELLDAVVFYDQALDAVDVAEFLNP